MMLKNLCQNFSSFGIISYLLHIIYNVISRQQETDRRCSAMTLAELKAQLQQEEAKVREIKRGQIIMAELPTVGGSVQNGMRPVIVISNDKANKFSPNIIAVPLTSRDKKSLPTHCKLQPTKTNGLKVTSTILCEQILTLSKDCIKKVIGMVDGEYLPMVDKAIKESIALF